MYQFPQAEDSGNPVRYDTASVSIYIEDVNDSPPLFLHSPYLAHVVENAADLPRQASFVYFLSTFHIYCAWTLPRIFPDSKLFHPPYLKHFDVTSKTPCRYPGFALQLRTNILFRRFVMKITAEDRDSSPYNDMKYSLKVRIYF
jgi:hypothetical protein